MDEQTTQSLSQLFEKAGICVDATSIPDIFITFLVDDSRLVKPMRRKLMKRRKI
ncbi:hypothetical protein JYU10_00730 [bacterium AH-315-J04]|nr:hypothetical protein [bacterium AH-315-J04]